MRVTTVFKRLMDLPGVTVSEVDFLPGKVVVTVKLSRRKLHCPECGFVTRARYDTRPVSSFWRHLDLGRWRLEVRADLRRIDCPTHGARTEGVPFARAGSHFSSDFEDLVGWLATTMDKTALCRLLRIDWDTTGRIIERVMATGLDPKRLDDLFVCGADEVSWRKGHSYLTLVSNNDTGKFVWGKEGKDTATLDCFFEELGPERSQAITAISMDMGAAFEKSARKQGHATKAVICFDPLRGMPQHSVSCLYQARLILPLGEDPAELARARKRPHQEVGFLGAPGRFWQLQPVPLDLGARWVLDLDRRPSFDPMAGFAVGPQLAGPQPLSKALVGELEAQLDRLVVKCGRPEMRIFGQACS